MGSDICLDLLQKSALKGEEEVETAKFLFVRANVDPLDDKVMADVPNSRL